MSHIGSSICYVRKIFRKIDISILILTRTLNAHLTHTLEKCPSQYAVLLSLYAITLLDMSSSLDIYLEYIIAYIFFSLSTSCFFGKSRKVFRTCYAEESRSLRKSSCSALDNTCCNRSLLHATSLRIVLHFHD